jgi:hypothetical protein
VLAAAATAGTVDSELLAVLALAIALSFAIGAPLAERGDQAYARLRPRLKRSERADRLPGDEDLHLRDVDVIVFGLGRIGGRAYAAVDADLPGRVLGVDVDPDIVAQSLGKGRRAVPGDATDPEFWSRAEGLLEQTQWVLLTMSSHEANVAAVESLRSRGYRGRVAATSTYPDDARELRALGADVAFDVYAEAGTGFASDLRFRMLNGGEADEAHLGHS